MLNLTVVFVLNRECHIYLSCVFLLLLLLSRFSHVRLCVTPQTAAHQALPYLGFCKHEHWSGLPFPSPLRESEKWKWSRSVMSDPSGPHGLQPTRLLHPWGFPGKSTGVGAISCLFSEETAVSKLNTALPGAGTSFGVLIVFDNFQGKYLGTNTDQF